MRMLAPTDAVCPCILGLTNKSQPTVNVSAIVSRFRSAK
jgi:hypothetical protein